MALGLAAGFATGIGVTAFAYKISQKPSPSRSSTETGSRCGTDSAPPHLQRIPTEPDGDCLYHSVAEGLIRNGVPHPADDPGVQWRAGERTGYRAGNLRQVLGSYIAKLKERGVDLQQFLMPGDDPETLQKRVTPQRCKLGSGQCGWAEYGEVALLAKLFGVCISVFVASEGYSPHTVVGATGTGLMDRSDSVETFRTGCDNGRVRLYILNVDSAHFDALIPCSGARHEDR